MGLEYHHCRGTQVTSNIGGSGERWGWGGHTQDANHDNQQRTQSANNNTDKQEQHLLHTGFRKCTSISYSLSYTSLQPLFTSCFLPSCGRYVQSTFLFLCHTHIPSSKHDNASSCRVDYAEITMGPHPWTVKVYAQLFQ